MSSNFPGPVTQHTEKMLREGRSPVAGGLTWAVGAGIVGALVGRSTGSDAAVWGLRAAACVYTGIALLDVPAWVLSRRAGRIAPVSELVGLAAVSAILLWVAFTR